MSNPKSQVSSPWSQDVYIKAYRFAARAHRWQKVPGSSFPYIMHLNLVSMEIMAAIAQGGFRLSRHQAQISHPSPKAAQEMPPLRTPTPRGVGADHGLAPRQAAMDADFALQCALLHDTLEDTRVRYEQIVDGFGEGVALGVLALTVNKRLPRNEQIPECLPRIQQQPREIWMVKLADRITNLQPPPRHWSRDRIRDYHQEAGVILDALHEASPFLADRLRLKIRDYAVYAA